LPSKSDSILGHPWQTNFRGKLTQALEKIKLESLKQTEIVKLNLQEGIERVKIEGNRDIELIKLRKLVWDKAIDTQMHFNEMSVKSRQLGLSFVVAALGLAVVLLGKNEGVIMTIPMPCFESFGCSSSWSFSSHIAAVIVLVAAAALYAVRRLDLDVYHRMLRGAVAFGEDMETESPRFSWRPVGLS
jgi:hypothetical protein